MSLAPPSRRSVGRRWPSRARKARSPTAARDDRRRRAMPSRTSVRMCVWGRSSGARRSVVIRNRPIAENAKEAASIASVWGPESSRTITPAMTGPMITDDEYTDSRMPFARARCSRPTRVGQRREVAGAEHRPEDAERPGDRHDNGHRRSAGDRRDRNQRRQERPPHIGHDHHPLAIAPVGEGAREEAKSEVGQRLDREDHTHRDARAGELEDEQRQRGDPDEVADRRDPLADREQPEISVLGQRPGVRGVGYGVSVGHRPAIVALRYRGPEAKFRRPR